MDKLARESGKSRKEIFRERDGFWYFPRWRYRRKQKEVANDCVRFQYLTGEEAEEIRVKCAAILRDAAIEDYDGDDDPAGAYFRCEKCDWHVLEDEFDTTEPFCIQCGFLLWVEPLSISDL